MDLLVEITDFLYLLVILEAEIDGFLEAQVGLGEPLGAGCQAQDGHEAPDVWIGVVKNICLGNGVLCCSQITYSQKAEAQVDPGSRAHSLLAALQEDSASIFPGLPLGVDDAEPLLQIGILQLFLQSQCLDVALLGVKQVAVEEEGVASHDPSFQIVLVLWKHLVESGGRLEVAALHRAHLGLGDQVLVRMGVLNIFQSNISSLVEIVLEQEINQLKENLITVIRLDVLVFRGHVLVIDDVNWILDRLRPEILGCIVLWLKLTKFTHPLDFGERKVLSGESWPIDRLKHEAHQDVGLDMLPVLFQDGVQISLSLLVHAILQVERAHEEIHVLVKANNIHVLVHEQLGVGCLVVLQAELCVVKPLLRIFFIGFTVSEEVLDVPLGMLVVTNQIVLSTEPLEFLVRRLFESSLQLLLLELKIQLVSDIQIVMNVEIVFLGVVKGLRKEVFHLLLQVGVELSFELLFLLLGRQASVVNFFVVLLDSKSEDGFLESLPLESIHLR